jgi:hypothetical protein
MPLEERLEKYGATTSNEYFAGRAAEKRLATRCKLRVEGAG